MKRDLSIVIPTLNERGNIEPLVSKLESVLESIDWEVVFVDDDSSDGTAERLYEMACENARVRLIRRMKRRGLSSACIEGMASCASSFLAVMDADLQHDESLLVDMYSVLANDDCDLVAASRFLGTEQPGGLTESRRRVSNLGNMLANVVLQQHLTDPLTGFFMLKSDVFQEVHRDLQGEGFKILVDILGSAKRPLAIQELPLNFRERHAGSSKLTLTVGLEYLSLLLGKLNQRLLPMRYIWFVLVGLSGAALHLLTLKTGLDIFGIPFWEAQTMATLVAMTSNYTLNNLVTYRDTTLSGRAWWLGLIKFYVICSLGMLANVKISNDLFAAGLSWWLAGLCGAIITSVWNFSVSSILVWRNR